MMDFYVYVLSFYDYQERTGYPLVFVSKKQAAKYCKDVYSLDALEIDTSWKRKEKNNWYIEQTCLMNFRE